MGCSSPLVSWHLGTNKLWRWRSQWGKKIYGHPWIWGSPRLGLEGTIGTLDREWLFLTPRQCEQYLWLALIILRKSCTHHTIPRLPCSNLRPADYSISTFIPTSSRFADESPMVREARAPTCPYTVKPCQPGEYHKVLEPWIDTLGRDQVTYWVDPVISVLGIYT